MVTLAETTFETEREEVSGAAAEDTEEAMCVNYYPGMLFDLYDEDMEIQERLFALQFFGVGEGIEVPGST